MTVEAILLLVAIGEVAAGFGFMSWQLRRLHNGLHQGAVSIAKLILQEGAQRGPLFIALCI